ncbi:MAG: PEP-CTERM sorting domain-containing protein [Gemmataceae bacterium]|nr:PEP-CTERM sorting domain-containing protein [Gemmataceae bacterium]
MFRTRFTRTMLGSLMMGIALTIASSTASAGPIGPGFDLFHTPAGGATVDIMGMMVPLMGKGIQGTDTDTMVERRGAVIPSGALGSFEIELVALSLQSIAPIQFSPSTPFFDVFVTINKGLFSQEDLPQTLPLAPSLGRMDITSHSDPVGGTFDSFFDVFAEITLQDIMTGDTMHMAADPVRLMSSQSTWLHTPVDPFGAWPTGGFAPVLVQHMGPHPNIRPSENPPRPSPEPSSILLLGLGLAGLVGLGKKRLVKRA